MKLLKNTANHFVAIVIATTLVAGVYAAAEYYPRFNDGQVLTAQHMNDILDMIKDNEARISALEGNTGGGTVVNEGDTINNGTSLDNQVEIDTERAYAYYMQVLNSGFSNPTHSVNLYGNKVTGSVSGNAKGETNLGYNALSGTGGWIDPYKGHETDIEPFPTAVAPGASSNGKFPKPTSLDNLSRQAEVLSRLGILGDVNVKAVLLNHGGGIGDPANPYDYTMSKSCNPQNDGGDFINDKNYFVIPGSQDARVYLHGKGYVFHADYDGSQQSTRAMCYTRAIAPNLTVEDIRPMVRAYLESNGIGSLQVTYAPEADYINFAPNYDTSTIQGYSNYDQGN